ADPIAQYADYALWHRRWLQGRVLDEQLAYWKSRLAGAPESLDLPMDRARPAVPTFEGDVVEFTITPELTEALTGLARGRDATLFMVLLAAFQVLLSRWARQDDVSVGLPVDGRGHRDAENLIGYFLNTVVLRSDLGRRPTFTDLLQSVRTNLVDAYDHRDLPFDRLVAELCPQRDVGHHPLYQVMFTYLAEEELRLGDLRLIRMDPDDRTSKFDLTLFVSEAGSGRGMNAGFEYSSDLFDRETVERLVGHFEVLLGGVVADPGARVVDLPLLSVGERRELVSGWHGSEVVFPGDVCVHELFEEQVARSPDAVAVVFGGESLSYRELNERANGVAWRLRSLGVGPETLVGVCVDRSVELVVGLLAVLKAGGGYVPLDPVYPVARLAYMLSDSRASVVLTSSDLVGHLGGIDAEMVALDGDWPLVAENPVNVAAPSNLAYCIYTSGSTGKPKGVGLQHANAVAFVAWARRAFSGEELARVLFSTSMCFDLSIFELFVPLAAGGAVVLVHNALALSESVVSPGPALLNTVPSAAQALLHAPASLAGVQVINLAGEPLRRELVDRLAAAAPQARVYNLYGPTEYTTYSTFCAVEGTSPITVGRPVANTQVFILDQRLEPAPIGVAGEIYLAGAGLARGYWQRPELTAEKFVPNPFGPPGSRMYKTGDLARFTRDGDVDFLGRIDHQVKIRGYRIELGEIENALLRCEHVRETVVVVGPDPLGERQLIAYLVGDDTAEATIPTQLRADLPDFMVPSVVIFLERLPLTPNGKIDRKALPTPGTEHLDLDNAYIAPRTPTEGLLAEIWSEVLNVDRIGIHDNFFALGGHSLLATQAVARIRHTLNAELLTRTLFEFPTIAEIAEFAETRSAGVL
ncbi:MAG TPA: amino acid adenylation domain-containing protein, partial [Mycobacterium sp.]|nr:amino acid adenylation domain-containing protein [Mycobacterium sp.]